MPTVTISLPESLRDFVAHQVKDKGYGNVSEYFRGLLRDAQVREEDRRLEALLLEGLDGADAGHVVDEKFWKKLKADAAQLIAKKSKTR